MPRLGPRLVPIHMPILTPLLLAVLVAVPAARAFAQRAGDRPPEFARWATVLQAAYEVGGEASYFDTLPTSETLARLPAGRGLSFALGTEFRPRDGSPYSYRVTIGRKYGLAVDDGPLLILRRWTLMAGVSRKASRWRSTLGVVAHVAPQVTDGRKAVRDYETAVGPMLEIGGRIFAGRVTAMTYRDESGQRFSALSVGVSATGLVCGILDRYDLPDKRRC